jgi:23S rRNA (guanosine2251-2'-O)-methyltransferase
MPGNSKRQGARRGDKKGATSGTGGKGRAKLRGRGPTPPAAMRPGHPAQRRAARADAASSRPDRGRKPKDSVELLVGRNPVAEALRAGIPATALHVAQGIDADERVTESVRRAGDRGIPILEVTRSELDRLTGGVLHQGIGLQVPPFEYAHPDDLVQGAGSLIVALDGVTDPRNLGAVVRSATAFGAHGVLIPERRASGMTATAWRTSAGTAARLPIARATNLTRALTAYQKAGLMVVGLDADADLSIDELDLSTEPMCLVVGSEGRGLSRLVGERCDLRVSIPMSGPAESLNASVAAAVLLAEVARRRRAAA